MTAYMRRGALLMTLLALSGGCSTGTRPTAPTVATATAEVSPPPPVTCSGSTAFEPVTQPSRVFLNVTTCPSPSRYVLYDDGTFVLEFQGSSYGYRGTYAETNGTVTFSWVDWSRAGPWGATGVLHDDDTMAVTYNPVMQLSDFDDATYTRVR